MKPLKLIVSSISRASYNLALEEYFVTQRSEDVLLFYINDPAVIIGKHQNPWKEVNIPYCRQNGIAINRRLSGGGTVYHDKNNVNFSFIRSKESDFVNFREHIEPISLALSKLGIDNWITDRNDIFIDEYKVSGNAEHLNNKHKRILHHGTLLFASDLDQLRAAIHSDISGIKTHAVNSVRSKVTTLNKYTEISETNVFLDGLIKHLEDIIEEELKLDDTIDSKVNELEMKKFMSWEWNIGHTPQFTYEIDSENSVVIRKGQIKEIKGPLFNKETKEMLIGEWYRIDHLKKLFGSERIPSIEYFCLPS